MRNKACRSSVAYRDSGIRVVRNLPAVLLGLALVGCDLTRGPAHEEVELIEAPTQLDSQATVLVPSHGLSLGYDVTYLCALFPPGYREDGHQWAMLDSAGDTVLIRAELGLSDGQVVETHFAAFVLAEGRDDYYCLGVGSTEAQSDSIKAKRPLPTVNTLRVWSTRPLLLHRLRWRASDAP